MTNNNSIDQQLADLEKKLEQLKARKQLLKNKQKSAARKERDHRLYMLGGLVEKYCGEIKNPAAFETYLQQYANAIIKWQNEHT